MHTFPTCQCLQNGVWDFLMFFSFSDLELFAKIKKDLASTNYRKPGLSMTQDLNNFKKNPRTLL